MPDLPEPRPGYVWGIRLYPGGRKEYRQYKPEDLMPYRIAEYLRAEGRTVRVSIDDAVHLLQREVLERNAEWWCIDP